MEHRSCEELLGRGGGGDGSCEEGEEGQGTGRGKEEVGEREEGGSGGMGKGEMEECRWYTSVLRNIEGLVLPGLEGWPHFMQWIKSHTYLFHTAIVRTTLAPFSSWWFLFRLFLQDFIRRQAPKTGVSG